MLKNIVKLTEKLISSKSIPTDSGVLKDVLELIETNLKGYTVERFNNKGVRSFLVYRQNNRPKKFKVILNGHLDIIPGKDYQYKPFIKNNRLYGVGAMDMKASVACFVVLFKEIADKLDYPLGLQLVTDEEVGGFDGTKYQIDQGVRSDFVIVGESTNFSIENEAKGILWVRISASGKSAHGAYPWLGENAIWKVNQFLNNLEKKYPVPSGMVWKTTVNLSRIETSNKALNKIPDDCLIELDIRYIPEDSDKIVASLKNLLPEGMKMEILVKEPAQYVDRNNEYIKRLQKAGEEVLKKRIPLVKANGSSDARHFTRVNCSAIEFGPIGGGMGSDEEWIDIESLEKYYEILRKFLLASGFYYNK